MRHFLTTILLIFCLGIVFGFRPKTLTAATATTASLTTCSGGTAAGYPCSNINLLSNLPIASIGGVVGTEGNDSWGWTDSRDGREYALMGLTNGTAFIDITNPINPIYLGHLATYTTNSIWRDIKVYQDHAFIVSEAVGHGMQIFDLRQLRDLATVPVTFSETAHYDGISKSHNIVINEESGFAYSVGSRGTGTQSNCASGLHMIDIHNVTAPSFAGCFSADGYTHDAHCVIYHGPDATYTGKEICFAANEDSLTMVDVTDKAAPVQLSRKTYSGSAYTHQGWFTEDHRYLLVNDELDELNNGHNTQTYIWDASDLDNPTLLSTYTGATGSIDHNLYIKGDQIFEANYRSGLRILDGSNIPAGTLSEVGYFDTYPANNNASFEGAWSTYPYFDSGVVIVSDINRGLFSLRPTFESGYGLAVTPSRVAICGDGTEALTLNAEQIGGFSELIDLTVTGLPTGVTWSSDLTQLSPGGANATISLQSTGAIDGTYSIVISGTTTSQNQATTLLLHQATMLATPMLTAPTNGSSEVSRQPLLGWVDNGAEQYMVQVSAESNFSTLLVDTTTNATNYAVTEGLAANTTYYWRIAAHNACGTSTFTPATAFTTRGMPVIAPEDTHVLFETDVETSTAGWTLGNHWTVSTSSSHRDTKSFFVPGANFTTVSSLLSPQVTIPVDESPALLSFWHEYQIEPDGTGCFDSAVLELSTNSGTNWQAVNNFMYGDTYTNGSNQWCGDSAGYKNVIVDLSDYAGQTIMLRFRFNSDANTALAGWHVDDIRLISSQSAPTAVTLSSSSLQSSQNQTMLLGFMLIVGTLSTGLCIIQRKPLN